MKRLEFVYFNIYNYCQHRSYSITNYPARLQTMYILSMSAGGWVLLMQAAFLRLVRGVWFSSASLAMSFAVSVYVITALLFYYVFIVNNYDEKIVNKYEKAPAKGFEQQKGLLFSALIVVIPYLLLLSLKLLFPRSH